MFSSILVPVDLTEQTRSSLDTAIALAGQSRGKVTLLHVIETIADAEYDEMRDFYKRLERKARASLEALARPLVAAGCNVEQQVIYGKRVKEIVLFAEEHANDLILMSSRAPDLDNRGTSWGSISHQVAILASCSVLLLK